MADAAAAPLIVPPEARGAVIAITTDWLDHRGLVAFPDSGWRCGDFCYYAAADHLPDMQRAWLIEGDVWPSFDDPASFFAPFVAQSADFLAAGYQPRGQDWFWWGLVRRVLPTAAVYGCLFPVTRMTRDAMLHLLGVRRTTIRAARTRAGVGADAGWRDRVAYPVPNDEGFVATVLTRDGYACADLAQLAPMAFDPTSYSWDAPLSPSEAMLPQLKDRMLHPVLEAAPARIKLAQLNDRTPQRFHDRREQVIARLGQEAWDAWSGM